MIPRRARALSPACKMSRSCLNIAQKLPRSSKTPLHCFRIRYSPPRCPYNSQRPESRSALAERCRSFEALSGGRFWQTWARQTPSRESVAVRAFSSTRWRRGVNKTVQQAESRHRAGGPFSWKAGVLFLITGAGMIVYFRTEKARMERRRIAEQTKGIGKPKVGGAFELVDHNGKRFTDEDMKGKYALVYFGFTHCPDICPEELDKMAIMIDTVKKETGNTMRPLFITCDPARDTPAVLKEYLQEFHPDLIGLTGSWENIKAMCKAYRVYFSTPSNVKPGQDYLVDHSIYFYLMDPEGDFVEALGRHLTPERSCKIITDHVKDRRGKLDRS